ncbi:Substrate-specific component RibU [Streptococcus sp. ZB199]|nr:Substrate-specific component RibU [Streptococcus sp. ZB199]
MTNTRKLTLVAVLSALSFILMFYQFSFLIDFFKIDLSIIAILLALVLLDFKSAVWVTLIRSVLKLALNNKGLETLIGLPINIIGVLVLSLLLRGFGTRNRPMVDLSWQRLLERSA